MQLQRGKIVVGICALAALPLLLCAPGRKQSLVPVSEAQFPVPPVSGQANHRLTAVELRSEGLGPQRGEPFGSAASLATQLPPASIASAPPSKPVPAPVAYRFAGTVSYQGKLRFLVTDGD